MVLVPIKAGVWQPDASHSFSHKVAASDAQRERKRSRCRTQTEPRRIQDGGGGGDGEERAVDRAGGRPTGLNRTGKSCRLRWVNYLHPGLKHGRMSPQEERLVLQLHAKWGNRWSRIARKLPGRTDNEIKNYWRTLMRKKAQERNGIAISSSSSSSSSTSSDASSPNNGPHVSGGIPVGSSLDLSEVKGYTTDQIWNEIAASDSVSDLTFEEYKDGGSACSMVGAPVASPIWELACESLWRIDSEDMTMMSSILQPAENRFSEALSFNYC